MPNHDLNKIVKLLIKKKLTVSFAESVTAGMVSYEFSKALEVSQVYKGSIVAYNEDIKMKILNVKKESLRKFTAESQEVTSEMAVGLKDLLKTDIAIAVTGLANPGGSESPDKPVGTVFISILTATQEFKYRTFLTGKREEIIHKTTDFIFDKLEELSGQL